MQNAPVDGHVVIDRSHDLYRRPAPPHAPEPAPPAELEPSADSVGPRDPVLPDVSAYWPDQPPAEQRSPFFYRRGAATPPAPGTAARTAPPRRPRRSRRRAVVIGLVSGVLLLATAGTGAAALLLRSDSGTGSEAAAALPTGHAPAVPPAPAVTAAPAAPVVTAAPAVTAVTAVTAAPAVTTLTAPLNGRTTASFELVNGASTVRLRSADLGGDLYRISTPAGSGVTPRASDLGTKVRLFVRPSGTDGPEVLTIVLNTAVRWDLLVTGGTERSVLDLSAGGLHSLELAGGAARIDLTLPRPDGALTVRMTGGVRDFQVRAPGSSVRVHARDGAGQVVLDGHTNRGVARGASFTPERWADNPHRIELDAVAGMGTLTVWTRSAE